MPRIVTAREQATMLAPWLNPTRRSMTAAVTLFTKPDCPQCMMTKKRLDVEGIPHEIRDVSTDPEAHAFVSDLGYRQAPVVHAGDDNHWSGFRPDRIKLLKGT